MKKTLDTEQITLFDIGGIEKDTKAERTERCYKIQIASAIQTTYEERMKWFEGFDTLKVITYSYGLNFIEKIAKNFKSIEIIIGAEHIANNDNDLAAATIDSLAELSVVDDRIMNKFKILHGMMRNGTAQIKVSRNTIDHRKLYLLQAEDGRTKTIVGSANMSETAWQGAHQHEMIFFDDSPDGYALCMEDFNDAWEESEEIAYTHEVTTHPDDTIDGNPILRKVVKTGPVVIINHNDTASAERTQWVIDKDREKKNLEKLKNDAKINLKNEYGDIELLPTHVTQLKSAQKRLLKREKAIKKDAIADIPKLKIDFIDGMTIDDKQIDFNVSDEDVMSDIENILKIFENFNVFVGDTKKLQNMHYKMLNAIFASPFFAPLKYITQTSDIAATFPRFILASSTSSNNGKTFMIKAAMKLMTGIDLPVQNAGSQGFGINGVRSCFSELQGFPFFVDEYNRSFQKNVTPLIKDDDFSMNANIKYLPMCIFASNDITEPQDFMRKRMMLFRFNNPLPDKDFRRDKFAAKGKAIQKSLTNSFYKKYMQLMFESLKKEVDYILNADKLPESYNLDSLNISSEILQELFTDYGFEIPEYMKILTWAKDYAPNAEYIFEDTIAEILKLYKRAPELVTLTYDEIAIELGNDEKKAKNWVNTLPSEVMAVTQPYGNRCHRVVIQDREMFEKIAGFRFGEEEKPDRGKRTLKKRISDAMIALKK